MKAIVVHAYGPPESLSYEDFPTPGDPGEGELLVKVVAAGVNPADGRLSAGEYPDLWTDFPRVNGRDVAGVVEAVGPGVAEYAPGDTIFGFSEIDRPGTWADYVTMKASAVAHAPRSISLVEAASLPVGALTAWLTLFVDFDLRSGQRLLINGAAGGVGSLAVQMAKAAGAYVIGSGSAGKLEAMRALGCDEVVDYRATPIDTVVDAVDAVLDGVGGDSLARSYGLVKPGGWLACLHGPTDPAIAQKRGIRASQTFGRVEPGLLEKIAQQVDAGHLRPFVRSVRPMSKAIEALIEVNAGHSFGKTVLVN